MSFKLIAFIAAVAVLFALWFFKQGESNTSPSQQGYPTPSSQYKLKP